MDVSDQPHMPFQQPQAHTPTEHGGPGCLVFLLWLFFIGWWLSALVIVITWILLVSGIGTRLAMRLLSRLPRLMFREYPTQAYLSNTAGVADMLESDRAEQQSVLVRLAYTILIGWWLSGLTLILAWLLLLSLIGASLAQRLYRQMPRLATFARYDV